MAITVKVRIVGVFLGNGGPIKVTVPKNDPTPADVLTEVTKMAFSGQIDNVTGFAYMPFQPTGNQDLHRVTVRYANSFKSTSTGAGYPAGIYSLSDEQDKNPFFDLVWQYYLFGPNGEYLIPLGFHTPFSQLDSTTRVVDGGTLIFRLVAIAKGPVHGERLERRLDKIKDELGIK